ncbi:hypothetical protein M0811_07939 [Anaeramoeba ignava]|uniref:BTB domain-containing protein n=1 Tax=Anaeramoeba ignava TaxID=1746090 RepID=A0A9Q0LLM5_ANAIG|nr:hypothetical protein M0811_07939 [Anaeramoeba ignava]
MNDVNIFDLEEEDEEIMKEFIEIFTQIYSINEDMNNFLKLNLNGVFSDFQIISKDSFVFNVNKLILLRRFDNDRIMFQKFINICKLKPKKEVEIILNFLYTGFPDFQELQNKLNLNLNEIQFPNEKKQEEQKQEQNELNEKENKITEFLKEIGIELNWIKQKKGRKGILKDLTKLYEEEITKDFTIIVSEKEIKVHKLILIIRSELFKGMFELNVQDSSNQVHDYSRKSFETIQQLIYFFYHDDLEEDKINEEIIIQELEDVKDYYQLNPNSIIDLILFHQTKDF